MALNVPFQGFKDSTTALLHNVEFSLVGRTEVLPHHSYFHFWVGPISATYFTIYQKWSNCRWLSGINTSPFLLPWGRETYVCPITGIWRHPSSNGIYSYFCFPQISTFTPSASVFVSHPLQSQVYVRCLGTLTTTPSMAGPLTFRELASTFWLATVAASPPEARETTSTSTAQTPASR